MDVHTGYAYKPCLYFHPYFILIVKLLYANIYIILSYFVLRQHLSSSNIRKYKKEQPIFLYYEFLIEYIIYIIVLQLCVPYV